VVITTVEMAQIDLEVPKLVKKMSLLWASEFLDAMPVIRRTVNIGPNLYVTVTQSRNSRTPRIPNTSFHIVKHWAWKEGAKTDDYVTNFFVPPSASEAFLWRCNVLTADNIAPNK
jgi:hypothetical protein